MDSGKTKHLWELTEPDQIIKEIVKNTESGRLVCIDIHDYLFLKKFFKKYTPKVDLFRDLPSTKDIIPKLPLILRVDINTSRNSALEGPDVGYYEQYIHTEFNSYPYKYLRSITILSCSIVTFTPKNKATFFASKVDEAVDQVITYKNSLLNSEL